MRLRQWRQRGLRLLLGAWGYITALAWFTAVNQSSKVNHSTSLPSLWTYAIATLVISIVTVYGLSKLSDKRVKHHTPSGSRVSQWNAKILVPAQMADTTIDQFCDAAIFVACVAFDQALQKSLPHQDQYRWKWLYVGVLMSLAALQIFLVNQSRTLLDRLKLHDDLDREEQHTLKTVERHLAGCLSYLLAFAFIGALYSTEKELFSFWDPSRVGFRWVFALLMLSAVTTYLVYSENVVTTDKLPADSSRFKFKAVEAMEAFNLIVTSTLTYIACLSLNGAVMASLRQLGVAAPPPQAGDIPVLDPNKPQPALVLMVSYAVLITIMSATIIVGIQNGAETLRRSADKTHEEEALFLRIREEQLQNSSDPVASGHGEEVDDGDDHETMSLLPGRKSSRGEVTAAFSQKAADVVSQGLSLVCAYAWSQVMKTSIQISALNNLLGIWLYALMTAAILTLLSILLAIEEKSQNPTVVAPANSPAGSDSETDDQYIEVFEVT